MADKTIKVISLTTTQQLMISELVEVAAVDIGQPDCKLVNPFKVVDNRLQPWLDFTDQTELMIHSDSILTIVDPTPELHSEYNNNIK